MTVRIFSKMLDQLQAVRKAERQKTVAELWKRNKLNQNASGYKVEETTSVRDGKEVTEYRLYKLIDSSVLTISSEVSAITEAGALAEKKKW